MSEKVKRYISTGVGLFSADEKTDRYGRPVVVMAYDFDALNAEVILLRSALSSAEKERDEAREELAWEMNALRDEREHRDIADDAARTLGEQLNAAEERTRVAERELEECKQRKGKIAAYRIVTEAENAHLRNLLREKPERDMDALIAAFCMVYTSPAWGGDERSPEGWEQKESALRKAFTSAISPERRFLSGLSILNKLSDENAALTASVEEWKRKAEEACKNLNGTRNDWQREFERGIELERELRSLRLSSIPVGVLIRWMNYWLNKSYTPVCEMLERLERRRSRSTNTKGE